jgi:hypothetical protein
MRRGETAKVRAVLREPGAEGSTEGTGPESAAASTERSSGPRRELSARSPGESLRPELPEQGPPVLTVVLSGKRWESGNSKGLDSAELKKTALTIKRR